MTANPEEKPKRIVVLSGKSSHAYRLEKFYVESFGREKVYLIREDPHFLTKAKSFLGQAVRREGMVRGLPLAFSQLLARALMGSEGKFNGIPFTPDFTTKTLRDPNLLEIVLGESQLMILNICSILPAELVKKTNFPIVNVHNGINPLYRGTGNLAAIRHGDFGNIGTTLHFVDSGVDTGRIIRVERFRISIAHKNYGDLNREAFDRGARLAVDFALGIIGAPPKVQVQEKGEYHRFPTLCYLLRTVYNFRREANSLSLRR